MKTVLFVCTGNYYRSRYAEELFNFSAPRRCPGWRAMSRGCALRLGEKNVGAIAVAAGEALEAGGITTFDRARARMPQQLASADLEAADHVVILDRDEHLPLMRAGFAAWLGTAVASRAEWWQVHDVDKVPSAEALPAIAAQVAALAQRLSR